MRNNKFDKNEPQYIPLDLGKMPPQAIELEEAVLGALLLESDSYFTVGHILTPECFYRDQHQKIYRAIQEMAFQDKKRDTLTVVEQLRINKQLEEIGGPYYLANLTSRVGGAGNIEFHALIIKQKYIAREFIRFSSQLQTQAYDESIDVSDLMELAQNELFKIISGTIAKEAVKASVLINLEIEKIDKIIKENIQCTGVPSGFTKLDRISGGWQSPDLIILAARPSQGKTAISLYFAKFPASLGIPVAFFSLEMSSAQIAKRIMSYETKIDSMKLSRGDIGNYEFKQLERGLGVFEKLELYIDDTAAISITELASKAKLYKMKYNIKIIIIDYLQLMQGEKGNNRDREIGTITSGLKTVAKMLDIPIICISQLNREVEKTGDKRPKLSDLRESGNIEQDADIVAFIHRPDSYGILEDEDGNSTVGMIDLIISKNRNGGTGDVILWTDKSFNNLREDKEFLPQLVDLSIPVNKDFNINKNIEVDKGDIPF